MKFASDEKTLILVDTCKINPDKHWASTLNGDLYNIIEYIKRNKLDNLIRIGLTDMVKAESLEHAKEYAKSDYDKYTNIKQNFLSLGIDIKDELGNWEEVSTKVTEKFESEIQNNKIIKNLAICDKNIKSAYKQLISKSVRKERPFTKNGNGFKDAVTIETLKRYRHIESYREVIIYTKNNKDFSDAINQLNTSSVLRYHQLIEDYSVLEEFLNQKYFLKYIHLFKLCTQKIILTFIRKKFKEDRIRIKDITLFNIRADLINSEKESLQDLFSTDEEFTDFQKDIIIGDYHIGYTSDSGEEKKKDISVWVDINSSEHDLLP